MKKLIDFVFFLFIITGTLSTSCDNDAVEGQYDEEPESEVNEALDFHNKVRADVDVDELIWDNELAEYAQEWAEYLVNEYDGQLKHRSTLNMNNKGFGENIYKSSSSTATALDASKAWYSEIEYYNDEAISSENYQKIGHYTQMVWQNTTKIGMGKAKTSTGAIIIVANYDPHGNVIGQKPY